MRQPIPIRSRPMDILLVVFFSINLLFISYGISLEQLVIADPSNFTYPLWPPKFIIDATHWYGKNFDPALIARPPWWKATIWIDVLFFGPFYASAIYAFIKGKEWIRFPSIVYASVMLTNVTIILFEESWGLHKSPYLLYVILANASWIAFPVLLLFRMRNQAHPFTQPINV